MGDESIRFQHLIFSYPPRISLSWVVPGYIRGPALGPRYSVWPHPLTQDNPSLATSYTWTFTLVVLPSCCLPSSMACLRSWRPPQDNSSSPPPIGDYGAGHLLDLARASGVEDFSKDTSWLELVTPSCCPPSLHQLQLFLREILQKSPLY